jgi:Chaperone of endosialidase
MMSPLIQLKKATPLFLVVSVFVCLALLPKAQAVVPAPDGGYPGGNTAEGQKAVLNLTTGTFNSALGFLSLSALTAGNFCTGVGAGALLLNTADGNTAVGAAALLSNTIGSGNTATGLSALGNNMDGIRNTANGVYALNHNISGGGNTAVGYQALVNNTASSNTAIGNDSLVLNSTGFENTAMGAGALAGNTTGQDNTAVGAGALASNGGGNFNNAFGRGALSSHTAGDGNVAVGDSALANHTTGTSNTAIGNSTLVNATTGDFNIALGLFAGQNITGNNNIDIGNAGVAAESDAIRIGNGSHTQAFIAGTFGVTTGGAAVPVVVDILGQLGTISSSRRFKNEIKPMDSASEAILALKPVTFHYKSDKTGMPQFGLIAEEVASVNPDLVVRDANGEIYTVRYDAVNAMLLNEFLKEHRTMQEQRTEIDVLKAELKQQRALIQKVSAQLEVRKPSP